MIAVGIAAPAIILSPKLSEALLSIGIREPSHRLDVGLLQPDQQRAVRQALIMASRAAGGRGSIPDRRVITYVNNYSDPTNGTTFTFASCDIGIASLDRRVLVSAHQYGSSSRQLSSATIAGVSATELTTDSSTQSGTVLLLAEVPAGTTGDIVLTWSGSVAGSAVGVWYATGLTRNTPIAAVRHGNGTAPTSGSIATSGGGFVWAAALVRYADTSSRTHSWSGATRDFQTELEKSGGDGASYSGATAVTTGANITVTDTFSISSVAGAGAFVTF